MISNVWWLTYFGFHTETPLFGNNDNLYSENKEWNVQMCHSSQYIVEIEIIKKFIIILSLFSRRNMYSSLHNFCYNSVLLTFSHIFIFPYISLFISKNTHSTTHLYTHTVYFYGRNEPLKTNKNIWLAKHSLTWHIHNDIQDKIKFGFIIQRDKRVQISF